MTPAPSQTNDENVCRSVGRPAFGDHSVVTHFSLILWNQSLTEAPVTTLWSPALFGARGYVRGSLRLVHPSAARKSVRMPGHPPAERANSDAQGGALCHLLPRQLRGHLQELTGS